MRVQLIAGNWKMNMTGPQACALVQGIAERVDQRPDVDVVVCPPFTAIERVKDELRDSHIKVGAQNMFWLEAGAYTGQISPKMLVDLRVDYVIVGHSETRGRFGVPSEDLKPVLGYFSETDETVNRKVKAALFHSIQPILCVGETSDERQAGKTDDVVRSQLTGGLRGVEPDELYGLVIAYEPVWAIGTGQTCDDEEANRVCGTIRQLLADMAGAEPADNIRVLYGGSVKASNAKGLLRQPEIDGALVGGASLDAHEFVEIIYGAQREA